MKQFDAWFQVASEAEVSNNDESYPIGRSSRASAANETTPILIKY